MTEDNVLISAESLSTLVKDSSKQSSSEGPGHQEFEKTALDQQEFEKTAQGKNGSGPQYWSPESPFGSSFRLGQ